METVLIKGGQLLLALSILVFIHELGHFLWARLFKVRVEKFYLFFDAYDKALLRWKPKGSETEYGIGWLPIGGYCKIAGMIDESMDKEQLAQEPKPWEFRTQSAFKRFMIMVGGVLNNVLFAILIYIGIMWYWGRDVVELRSFDEGMAYSEYAHSLGFEDGDILWSVDGQEVTYGEHASALLLANEATVKRNGRLVEIALPDTMGRFFLRNEAQLRDFMRLRIPVVVGKVVDQSSAQVAGLLAGDSITAVNGMATPYFDLFRGQITSHAGDTVWVGLMREGVSMTLPVVVDPDSIIGIQLADRMLDKGHFRHITYSFIEAIPVGVVRCYDMLYNYLRQFKLVFTKEGAQSLGGFGTMASIFPDAWDWHSFWTLTAFISIALAVINILPIPALDGGHILFLLIEVVTGRKPSDRVLEIAQYIGFFLIIALMIYVNANDIWRFIIKPFM